MTLSSDSQPASGVPGAPLPVLPAHAHARGGAGSLVSLRNVGICAHIDAGKTTLTERILYQTGTERHIGRVDEGTSVMDWMSEERERGITITAAATRVSWKGIEINLVDTPGHVDFTVEVERAMRVLDGAVLVLDAAAGVEPQTETVWRQVRRQAVPAIGFVNKCERPGADVLACAASVESRLGAKALVIAYPIGGGDTGEPLQGIVDLVHRRAWGVVKPGSIGLEGQIDVPEAVADEVDVLRAELVEALGDLDDSMCELLAEGREPSGEQIAGALRRLVLRQAVVPLLCGAALIGQGVALLLDAIAAYLPSPTDVPVPPLFVAAGGAEAPDGPPPEPLALVFKVHSTRTRGERRDVTFVRVYTGEIAAGTRLWNDRTGVTEEVLGVLRIHAADVQHIDRALAGDVVALAGLRATGTGDTLVPEGCKVRLEPPVLPAPVLGYLVEPVRDEERLTLRDALERLAREDPSLRLAEDPASGQWLLEGMGELHLEIALARMTSEYGVTPRKSSYRIAFREVVSRAATGSGEIERLYGDTLGRARVEVRIEPAEDGEIGRGLTVAFGPAVRIEPSRARALRTALMAEAQSGPIAGHPVRGVVIVVTSVDLPANSEGELLRIEGDAVETAAEQAAVAALRDALRNANSEGHVVVMEPTMTFVVETPDDVSGGVIGDLNSRHAIMDEVISTGTESRRVTGKAPLRGLLGYSTSLRSLSKGRATFSMEPSGMTPHVGDLGRSATRPT
ncbi:Elongation factor G [Planctomycetes bacterium Poly30]|uniref:Elongation factor G n=1 Tax=Saltatorellus ferox TaxID=2528018 RepID=A0A518EWF5_9BACT|nr:Elongation factor G [Planctomycetes bacterium Poly30]